MHRFILLGLLPLLGLTACGDKDDDTGTAAEADTDTDTDADLTGIALSTDATEVDSDQTITFTVDGETSDGSSVDLTLDADAASGDEDIFRIYETGVVQPVGGGTATLTVTYGDFEDSVELTITAVAPTGSDLVINEVLTDGGTEGDPNGDGTLDKTDDEFIEIVNAATYSVDLSGVTITENEFAFLPRHTFADGSLLKPGEAVVVFGGGDTSNLGVDNAWFVVADNEDAGTLYGLDFGDDGDRISLNDADGNALTSVAYGDHVLSSSDAVKDASLTLDTDVTGTLYVDHTTVGAGPFSAGTMADGTAFEGPDGVFGE